MATIREVAQAAQVSATTVSRVLNRDESLSVSAEVRARIFEAAHALGYAPPRQRRAAQAKKKLVIGVADWRIIRPDRPNVRLSSLSCLVDMMTGEYDVAFIRLVYGRPQPVDGVIAFGAFSAQEMDFLRSLSFALVFVNSGRHSYEFDQVQVDFEQGLEQMASYLLDGKGYASVGYIGGVYEGPGGTIGAKRMLGLQRALEARGAFCPELFHTGEISRESGRALALAAAQGGALARAVLLGSDEVAEGALEGLRQAGLRVPQDVAAVVYQDIPTLENRWPGCTCIEMYPDYVWQNALELLFGRIGQRRTQPVTVTVPTRIRLGGTA